jgi:hypothetical protein
MFGISFSFLVMLVMFGVLIVGIVKALRDLVNDETGVKRVAPNSGIRMRAGPSFQGSATK